MSWHGSLRSANSYTFKTLDVDSKQLQVQAVQSGLVSPSARSDFQMTLGDLKRNTRYALIVQAFNKKGPGPSSDEIVAQTLEFGEHLDRASAFAGSFRFSRAIPS